MTDDIITPRCPGCHQPPSLIMDVEQVFCSSEDCQVVAWNTTQSREEFWATARRLDLSPQDPGPGAE